jgi:flagellar motor switch protein FliM
MEKILSQEEIDALLRGMESGEVSTQSEKSGRSGLTLYDFANQDRIIRGRMPTLEIINDHFSRCLRNTLSSSLRRILDVGSRGVQMVKFGEFIKTLPVPSSLHIFRMEPLRGHAILALESKLVFTLLDVFFGGSGKTGFRIEGRDFTAIETRFIQKIVTMVFQDLEKAWNAVFPLKMNHVRSEINPQFVSIVPPSDLVIIVPFGIELEQFTGLITFCVPYSTIEPIKAKLYSGYQSDQLEMDHHWIDRFTECMKNVEVELKVEFGRSKITVQDLLKLKVGDFFPLGKDVSEPLIVEVQGVPKFIARPGLCGGNKAVQVDDRMGTS